MNIVTQIDEDIKAAMRAKDTARLGVLRMLKSSLKYAAIEHGGASVVLDDVDAVTVIRKQIKQRQDSIASYEKAERKDLADTEKTELAVLESYLPQGLSAEEISALVQDCIQEAGANTRAQMGAVMKLVTPRAAGRADGRSLSAEVQKQLA